MLEFDYDDFKCSQKDSAANQFVQALPQMLLKQFLVRDAFPAS